MPTYKALITYSDGEHWREPIPAINLEVTADGELTITVGTEGLQIEVGDVSSGICLDPLPE